MAVLSTPIGTVGAITEPTDKYPFLLPSAESATWDKTLPWSVTRLPAGHGVMVANGWDPVRHIIDEAVYGTGLQAPSSAPTATPSGAQATATLDLDADSNATAFHPTDGLTFQLGTSNLGTQTIKVVASLTPSLWATHEVLRGASAAEFLANLQALVEQTPGAEGVTHNTLDATQFSEIEVSASDSTSITFRAKDYGAGGNGLFAYLKSGTWSSGGNTASLGSQGTTVGTTGYFENGSNGSGSYPSAGTYRYFYTYFRSIDGAESGPSPIVTASQGAAQQIALASLSDPATPADSSVDFIRIYRTEANGSEFFRLAEIATGGAGTYTDQTPDGLENGSLQQYGNIPYDFDLYRSYQEGVPPRVRFLTTWKGSVWGGGAILAAKYDKGTASVTADSQSVTLSSVAVPTTEMVGRTFQVDGDSETYLILSVAPATRVLTLDRVYQGSTAGTASYEIRDERDPNQIYGTVPGLYNQWPTLFNPGQVDPEGDDEGITGMYATRDALLVWSRSAMYRVTGEDELSWQVHKVEGGPGCACGQTVIGVAGGVVWLGDDLEVYLWDGGGAQRLAVPPVGAGERAVGIRGTMARINKAALQRAFSWYCEASKVLRIYVPLDDAVTPNFALVFDLSQPGTWTLDHALTATAMGRAKHPDGSEVCLGVDALGTVWQFDKGASFGHYGVEPVQTIGSSSTVRTIEADSGTPWSSSTLTGVPCVVVYAAGTFANAIIESNDGDTLTLREDLAAAPAEDDQVIVGWQAAEWKSGHMVRDLWDEISLRDTQVMCAEDAVAATLFYAVGKNRGALSVPVDGDDLNHDMSEAEGVSRFRDDQYGTFFQQQFTIVQPGLTTGRLMARVLSWEPRS